MRGRQVQNIRQKRWEKAHEGRETESQHLRVGKNRGNCVPSFLLTKEEMEAQGGAGRVGGCK